MTSIVLKKNMFMKRYGLFKSVVYKDMQLRSFIIHVRILLNTIEYTYDCESKVLIAKEMFEYLSGTKDIWWLLEGFSNAVKDKTVEIASEHPELQKYIGDFRTGI